MNQSSISEQTKVTQTMWQKRTQPLKNYLFTCSYTVKLQCSLAGFFPRFTYIQYTNKVHVKILTNAPRVFYCRIIIVIYYKSFTLQQLPKFVDASLHWNEFKSSYEHGVHIMEVKKRQGCLCLYKDVLFSIIWQ